MIDLHKPRTLVLALATAYAIVTFGVYFSESPDDRIGGLLFFFVLLAGLFAGTVTRFRPVPMVILLWILAAAQALVMIALLAARIGDPGVMAFVNVVLIGGMVFVAGAFRRAAGPGPGS